MITTAIGKRNFEIIRDQIGLILSLEYANQYSLDNTIPAVNKVWVERCLTFNSETEAPAINVTFSHGDYTGVTLKKSDGRYIFNIDVYCSAASSAENGPGDQYAMVRMQRIMGIIHGILSNPQYTNTGLALTPRQTTTIPHVILMAVRDRSTLPDALSDVVGRIQYSVGAIESVEANLEQGNPLQESTTNVKLQGGPQGFFYDIIYPQWN